MSFMTIKVMNYICSNPLLIHPPNKQTPLDQKRCHKKLYLVDLMQH